MTLHHTSLAEVTVADLTRLVTDEIVEDKVLEYKRNVPEGREGTALITDALCSFANSVGGGVVAIRYRVSKAPTIQSASVAASKEATRSRSPM